MSFVTLADGQRWRFDDPEGSARDLTIATIAHQLANLCRFTGAPSRFYSVAQHSVLVAQLAADIVARRGGSPYEQRETARAALLHDAAEIITGDVSTPFKALLAGAFAYLAEPIERAIAQAFDVSYPMLPEVKQADAVALQLEAAVLMPPSFGASVPNELPCFYSSPRFALAPDAAQHVFLSEWQRVSR